jgi:hypothetical protein
MTVNEIKKELIQIFRKYYPSMTVDSDGLTKSQKELFEEMGNYVHDNFKKKSNKDVKKKCLNCIHRGDEIDCPLVFVGKKIEKSFFCKYFEERKCEKV